MDLLQSMPPGNARQARSDASQRAGVVVVVVTAGPTGEATVVVCWVVVAGLGCSTRSDRNEQADVAASRQIKIVARMAEASLQDARQQGNASPLRPNRVLKGSPLRWLRLDVQSSACAPIGRRQVVRLAMMCAVALQATAGSRGQHRYLFMEASELQGRRPRRLNGGDAPTAVLRRSRRSSMAIHGARATVPADTPLPLPGRSLAPEDRRRSGSVGWNTVHSSS